MMLNKTMASVSWLFGFVVTIFIGTIIYQTTLLDDSNKITMHEGVAWGWPGKDGLLNIRYVRGFTVTTSGEGELLQKVVCVCPKGEITEYDRPPLRRVFEAGVYPGVARIIETPMKEPVGSRCKLNSYGVWRAPYAISSQMRLLDTLEFTVTAKAPE